MTTSNFNLQPDILENEITKLIPLEEKHFEELFKVASDPLIWEQHPSKDRYHREGFTAFFEMAINSKGSFLILDKQTNEIIGTTRFYEYNPEKSSVAIGYTFLARKFWGGPYNKSNKKLLIDYAFQHVDSIFFHVGAENFRSQKAVLKLGAEKVRDMILTANGIDMPYFEYELKK
ncbi:GNAT family N-acetyltransferase [Flavobacterium quisquiliarum]|uniref:GNAT family N-acetyltransferase n=1 Tax=Flavobacterium quisquiliarum TaxID=1834436 RepID=A0ABV8W960_9FLAO|nr:GNAT family N-acetyltransferase [Flavobacterium quisquiliarum]MBW1654219.1 GNAT family N-acetyltransferase [Flavobacterium quisquiliarum]NWL00788.1 N-acetyltransferase [Flavobacterium collinsii]